MNTKAYTILKYVGISCLLFGGLLCLINIRDFSDQNVGLMVGLGFMVASGFLYIIAAAMNIFIEHVDAKRDNKKEG